MPKPQQPPSSQPPPFSVLIQLLERVEALATHELNLIGNRMTWFAISQSFLFGAYATIATDNARLLKAFGPGGVGSNEAGAATIKLFLIALPIIGFLFALAARISTAAADRVLSFLDPARGNLLIALNAHPDANDCEAIPVIGNGQQRAAFNAKLGSTIIHGNVGQRCLPWAMMLVWAWALLSRFDWGAITDTLRKSLGAP